MQREDLKLRMKQIARKTYWQTSPHLKHQVSELEACGALKVTIVTTNLECIAPPGQINLSTHNKGIAGRRKVLAEGKASCPFAGINAVYLCLYYPTRAVPFSTKNHETCKKTK